MSDNKKLFNITSRFIPSSEIGEIKELGDGLINSTFVVVSPKGERTHVLQKINHHVFTDVAGLMFNIDAVTRHLRKKGVMTLHFLPDTSTGKLWVETEGEYWRLMDYIPDSVSQNVVSPESSNIVGKCFGQFEAQLADIPEHLNDTIPNFHNMESRLGQLDESRAKCTNSERLLKSKELLEGIDAVRDEMTLGEKLGRSGKLPKRICHCDTKVNNILFSKTTGDVLCVIDLDTVMPSFVFSDYGDFLRFAAATAPEDEPDITRMHFNMEIFKAFTSGYIESTKPFLTPIERENLPFAATLFPYMQTVRFLADYLDGDHYFRANYPEHNFVRARAQFALYKDAVAHVDAMKEYINSLP